MKRRGILDGKTIVEIKDKNKITKNQIDVENLGGGNGEVKTFKVKVKIIQGLDNAYGYLVYFDEKQNLKFIELNKDFEVNMCAYTPFGFSVDTDITIKNFIDYNYDSPSFEDINRPSSPIMEDGIIRISFEEH